MLHPGMIVSLSVHKRCASAALLSLRLHALHTKALLRSQAQGACGKRPQSCQKSVRLSNGLAVIMHGCIMSSMRCAMVGSDASPALLAATGVIHP